MTTSPASPGLLSRLAAVTTADVCDAMDRMGAVDPGIRPLWPGARAVGTAYTVWTRAGDNVFVHRALRHVEPGMFVVVNGGGDISRSLIGSRMSQTALERGAVGFVIDGAVRDVEELREVGLPVFARGVTPAGPYKHGPGRLQVPVAIGGAVVMPGDVVVADGDGVVIVPAAEVAVVTEGAERAANALVELPPEAER